MLGKGECRFIPPTLQSWEIGSPLTEPLDAGQSR